MVDGLKELHDYYQNNDICSDKRIPTGVEKLRNRIAIEYYNLSEDNEKAMREFGDLFAIDNRNWKDMGLPASMDKYKDYTEGYFFVSMLIKGTSDESKGGRINHEQERFKTIVDKIIARTLLTRIEINHINIRTTKDLDQWRDISGLQPLHYRKYENNETTLMALYDFVIALSRGEVVVKHCEAEDCSRLFVPYNSGTGQKYCSTNCRVKSFQQKQKAING